MPLRRLYEYYYWPPRRRVPKNINKPRKQCRNRPGSEARTDFRNRRNCATKPPSELRPRCTVVIKCAQCPQKRSTRRGAWTVGRTAARASTTRLKVRLPSTADRSRDATDASRAPRSLRRVEPRNNCKASSVGQKASLIWQHKSPNQKSRISIAASDQEWTSRTRRRRTPMPA